jgi:hypothetical protein
VNVLKVFFCLSQFSEEYSVPYTQVLASNTDTQVLAPCCADLWQLVGYFFLQTFELPAKYLQELDK